MRGKDRWRYYDWEMLDWGLRFSDGENLPQGIQDGFNQYQGEELRKAVRLLRKFNARDQPKTVRAFRPYAAAGQTEKAIEAAMLKGQNRERFYDDPDGGPLLLSDAFEALRKKYPQAKK